MCLLFLHNNLLTVYCLSVGNSCPSAQAGVNNCADTVGTCSVDGQGLSSAPYRDPALSLWLPQLSCQYPMNQAEASREGTWGSAVNATLHSVGNLWGTAQGAHHFLVGLGIQPQGYHSLGESHCLAAGYLNLLLESIVLTLFLQKCPIIPLSSQANPQLYNPSFLAWVTCLETQGSPWVLSHLDFDRKPNSASWLPVGQPRAGPFASGVVRKV